MAFLLIQGLVAWEREVRAGMSCSWDLGSAPSRGLVRRFRRTLRARPELEVVDAWNLRMGAKKRGGRLICVCGKIGERSLV